MKRVIILMYHIVDTPRGPEEVKYCCTSAEFDKQMRFLRDSNYVPVSMGRFVDDP